MLGRYYIILCLYYVFVCGDCDFKKALPDWENAVTEDLNDLRNCH